MYNKMTAKCGIRQKQTTVLADASVAMVIPTVIITTDKYFVRLYLSQQHINISNKLSHTTTHRPLIIKL